MTVRIGQAEFWKTGRFLQAAVLLSAAFPIMPFFARSASVILLLIVALLEFRKISKSEWRLFLVLFCLAYLSLVFSLIVTQNLDKGFNELGQLAPLNIATSSFFLIKGSTNKCFIKTLCGRVHCFNFFVGVLSARENWASMESIVLTNNGVRSYSL